MKSVSLRRWVICCPKQKLPTLIGLTKKQQRTDGPNTVRDSWAIACYLEDTYPTANSLFGGPEGRALARFFNLWTDTQLQPALFQVIIGDLFEHVVDPADQAYFRETREKRFGKTIEEIHAARPEKLAAFKAALTPLRLLLAEQPFVSGAFSIA